MMGDLPGRALAHTQFAQIEWHADIFFTTTAPLSSKRTQSFLGFPYPVRALLVIIVLVWVY